MRPSAWRGSATPRLLLLLIVASCCNGCAMAGSDPSLCPSWPVAGPAVADELARIDPAELAATWAWIGRLDRLRAQLEECRR